MTNLIGQRLGQYEVLSLLGEGGMAAVYRAQQLNIKREVAIKVIKTGLLGSERLEEFVKRFQREAETIGVLDHPHILKLFDYGQHQDTVYLVTQYLRGGSLADQIKQGILSPERAAQLLDQIAQALDYAHERGIVHRDLKPQNVLLDEKGNAILTDFGIARLMGEATQLTQSGTVIGTPSYMAPEQWQRGKVDARADLYALGIMVYEMLSGKVPFEADTPFQLMYAHLQETPPPIRSVRPELSQSVEMVLNKALAKAPQDRFQSAGQFAEVFKAALAGKVPLDLEATARVLPSPSAPLPRGERKRRAQLGPRGKRIARWLIAGEIVIGAALIMMGLLVAREGWGQPSPASTDTPFPTVKINRNWTPVTQTFDGVEMVLAPPGCFKMGGDIYYDERPLHEICFEQPFWIDRYEVTNEQFAKFGGNAKQESGWKDAKRPREQITWFEARDFCTLRGARLPTEAEWEYAARGPNGLEYPWGNTFLMDNVVYKANSNGQTAPVGSKPGGASWVGALDLSGNVWEWVSTIEKPYPYKADDGRENRDDANSARVLRGGAWDFIDFHLRSAVRLKLDPGLQYNFYGFRCARAY